MRRMPPLLAALLLQADPAALFRDMCKAVDDARSLRVDAKADVAQEKGAAALSSSLRLQGVVARLDVATSRDAAKHETKLTYREAQCWELENGRMLPPEDVHATSVRRLQAAAARIGFAGLAFLASAAKFDRKTRNDVPDAAAMDFSDFALAGEEAVGERKAWKVSCKASLQDSGVPPIAVAVWIDKERNVPLKRAIEAKDRGRDVSIVEIASRFELNVEITDEELKTPHK